MPRPYRIAATLSALALLAIGTSAAQTAPNEVMLDTGIVRYAWRGEIGADANGGELHQAFEERSWRGLGDLGSLCEVAGFRARNFQDQDSSTAETFRWLVRVGSDDAGPDLASQGLFYRSGPIQLAPAMGSGPQAYEVTTLLQTPVQGGCSQFFTIGCELPAASAWPNDGQCVWVASRLNGIDDHLANPRATDSAWQRVGLATSPTTPYGELSWRLGFLSRMPVLSFGNLVAAPPRERFGKGGLFPRTGQGLSARLVADGRAGQVAVLLLSPTFSATPLPIFAGTRLWIDLGSFVGPITAAPITRQGNVDVAELLVAPAIPATAFGDFAWQAMVFDPIRATVTLSNAVRTSL